MNRIFGQTPVKTEFLLCSRENSEPKKIDECNKLCEITHMHKPLKNTCVCMRFRGGMKSAHRHKNNMDHLLSLQVTV